MQTNARARTFIHTGRTIVGVAVALAAGLAFGPLAHAQEARGVNPADNLTKFEVLPKLTVLEDRAGVSSTTVTLKYDRAIKGIFGVNVELPLTRMEAPGTSENGLGDLNVRGRVQGKVGRWVFIAGAEAVLPVASDDALGSGKVQLNPTVVGVYAFSGSVFVAGVAKHLFSVAGDSDRADIRQGQ
ncbi:MAG: hypothetical protein ACOY3Y_15455 [Acidobacteriota bacterium]